MAQFFLPVSGSSSIQEADVEQVEHGDYVPPPVVGFDEKAAARFAAAGSTLILLVEDNEDNRSIYTTILRHYGYEVVEALSGEEGVSLAGSLQPALVLMDVGLPGIDGWEATRRIKGDPGTRHIPVVALTAHAMAEHRAASFAAGCDGYLTKPIEPRDVLDEVRHFLHGVGRLTA